MSFERLDPKLSDEDLEKQKRELLLKIYASTLDEYRFNVNIGWDQTKFYVTTSSAATAAGVGLLRLAIDSKILSAFMILYFLLPGFIALLGFKTTEVRKKYIREANLKKTLVELELGLFKDTIPEVPGTHLGIAVTPGQKGVLTAIIKRRDRANDPVKIGTVVHFTKLLFYGLVAISATGASLSYINLLLLSDAASDQQKIERR
ncbi:hypothetical protein [Methylobacterium sp. Leaf456]|uniref:hypothetical protein n=1 Tax=Methylobacterium sp. Leaf456 TaxID=1736382 RepID=UPI0012E33841|nr:hypothetical protein [Methylobacterium sp. Leaf456]